MHVTRALVGHVRVDVRCTTGRQKSKAPEHKDEFVSLSLRPDTGWSRSLAAGTDYLSGRPTLITNVSRTSIALTDLNGVDGVSSMAVPLSSLREKSPVSATLCPKQPSPVSSLCMPASPVSPECLDLASLYSQYVVTVPPKAHTTK